VRHRDLDQRLLYLAVVERLLLIGIGRGGAQVTERQIWQLGHEHRRLPAGR
jgi:hypothetical protein